jgi:hypothetical protein
LAPRVDVRAGGEQDLDHLAVGALDRVVERQLAKSGAGQRIVDAVFELGMKREELADARRVVRPDRRRERGGGVGGEVGCFHGGVRRYQPRSPRQPARMGAPRRAGRSGVPSLRRCRGRGTCECPRPGDDLEDRGSGARPSPSPAGTGIRPGQGGRPPLAGGQAEAGFSQGKSN